MRTPEESRYRRQMILGSVAVLLLACGGVREWLAGSASGPALVVVALVISLALWTRWQSRPR